MSSTQAAEKKAPAAAPAPAVVEQYPRSLSSFCDELRRSGQPRYLVEGFHRHAVTDNLDDDERPRDEWRRLFDAWAAAPAR